MRKLRRGRAPLFAAALMFVLAAAGCGDNAGNPVGYGPEGVPGQAVLLLHAVPDSTLTTFSLIASIFAPPPTNGFRVYIEPDGQGFRPATEAAVPAATSLGSGWSVYTAVVDGYDPAIPTQFIARGARNGIESVASAVTNTAFLPATDWAGLITYLPLTATLPGDSTGTTPTLAWNAVPGATRYLVQIFKVTLELQYAVYTSETTHQYGVAGPGVIFEQLPLRGGPHFMIVQGIDGGSHVFAVSQPQFFNVTVPPAP